MPELDIESYAKLLAMARTPVESTNVASYGYDKLMKVITVEFNNTSHDVYGYLDCSEQDLEDFVKAESMGSHVHKVLKKQHEVVKLT